MVLMKLRLNVSYQDLAYRFGVSQSTVSRTFAHWLLIMDVHLSPLIRWPEREELWKTMPQCFKFSFGNKKTVSLEGRTSDKHLTENCCLLNKLLPGDLVMADRGFTIHDGVARKTSITYYIY